MLCAFEDPVHFIFSNRLDKDVNDTFRVDFRAKKGLVPLPNPYITILPLKVLHNTAEFPLCLSCWEAQKSHSMLQ